MVLEVRPLKNKCNLACKYCYENTLKDAGNAKDFCEIEAVKSLLKKEDRPFALFGGEPLLLDEKELESFFSLGFERYKRNIIQTNGTLINDNHIRMFGQYKAVVGISIDGPGECNDLRWAGTLEKTREATAKTENAILRLCSENIPTALIVTLHRQNAVREKLPVMLDWLRGLIRKGARYVRLHILEAYNPVVLGRYSLSSEETSEAMLAFAALSEELKRDFIDIFNDMKHLLKGDDSRASCVWRACDFYSSESVDTLGTNGEMINCGHSHKEGIEFLKADTRGYERYIALYHTPQEHGGCGECRFFLMCKGWCPSSAMNGDWRNRTAHCGTWKTLYKHFEHRMNSRGEKPLSMRQIRKDVEQEMLAAWTMGRNPTIRSILKDMD